METHEPYSHHHLPPLRNRVFAKLIKKGIVFNNNGGDGHVYHCLPRQNDLEIYEIIINHQEYAVYPCLTHMAMDQYLLIPFLGE